MDDHATRAKADLRALLEREARLRSLMDAAFDGIVISHDGIIIEVSEALLELSGYTRREVIGQQVTTFIAPECRQDVTERVSADSEGRLDTIGLTKSGQRRRMEIVSRNHVVAGGVVRLTAVRDVTELRRLEEQLQQAQKMEALARLARGIAHDFNNVLLIIGGLASLLAEDLEEPRRADAMEILRAVDSGAALTKLLMTYARQDPTAPQVLSLNAIVREAEPMLRHLIGKGVRLTTNLAPDLADVRADPTQIKQVILNLVTNARDAMPDGGTLEVHTRNVQIGGADDATGVAPRAGHYAALLVVDSGMGMSSEVRARIFEPFFSTKEPGKGTGLGLEIVQQIIGRSGGFIRVESAADAGSTFSVHLPHADSSD